MSAARLRHPLGKVVHVGPGCPTRVAALIGSTSRRDTRLAQSKVEALIAMERPPDVIADLSVRVDADPLWNLALQSGVLASGLPVYTVSRDRDGRIADSALLERCAWLLEGGVGLLTIHPTANSRLLDLAAKRHVPWTSRGGGLIIGDLHRRSRHADNAYVRILPELVTLARRAGAALSLGATFRSATIFDSADACQLAEIDRQLELAALIRGQGVDVVIEGPGHARPRDIAAVASRLAASGFPIMPLGPMPTDAALDQDHVAAAVGVTLFGLAGCASLIAAVTRHEHTGGVPPIAATVEAVRAAQTAAHIIDLELLDDDQMDADAASARAATHTCVVGRRFPGCARCGDTCPLTSHESHTRNQEDGGFADFGDALLDHGGCSISD